jgi:citrate synthase
VTWRTAITDARPNEVRVRGHRVDELMGRVSFGEAVYLILRGDLPSADVGRLVEAILVACVDHGPAAPSAATTRRVAGTGAPLNAAVAAGLLAVNRFHGGAIEGCMAVLTDAVGRGAEAVVSEARAAKRRLPGFGHRMHTADPRTARLYELAGEAGISLTHLEAARAVEAALEAASGRALPINVDGAIAACLCDLGFSAEVANAFFLAGRLVGLVAHTLEERSRERPMRRFSETDFEYDGPAPRDVPTVDER